MAIVKITKDNFEQEVLHSDIPVLVDFFATWCGPCKMFAPILDSFAEELSGVVKVGKIDIDSDGELAQRYRVMQVPTLKVFKNGEVTATSVGVISKERIKELIGE